MTAADARKLTQAAASLDEGKVRIVLDAWLLAIEKAAKEGRNSVTEQEVSRPRTPIPPACRRAAPYAATA